MCTTVTYPGAGAKTGKKGQNQTTEAATRPPATLKELKKHNIISTKYFHDRETDVLFSFRCADFSN